MGAFFTAILAKFTGLATFFIALATAFFVAFWLLGTDLGVWFFEQVLDLLISILNSFSFDLSIFNLSNYLAGIPPDLANMLGLIRLGEAFTIIFSAIVIKITLQLIPFTRLGS